MRKILTFIYSFLTCIMTVNAAVVEGTCGTNLTWSLDTQDSTLTISGTGAMDDYYSYRRPAWDNYRSYIAYLSIEEGVTSIGNIAFSGCNSLKRLSLPTSVKYINGEAFRHCAMLSDLSLGNILSLGKGAFQDCDALVNVELPLSLSGIGSSAFSGCDNLVSVNIGKVKYIGDEAFYNCVKLDTITSTDSLVSIGKSSFSGCGKLQTFPMSDKLNSIGELAFYHCYEITSVELPEGVETIGKYAFDGCRGIEVLTLPNSIVGIGEYAFSGCSKITSIVIPKNLRVLAQCTFYGCRGITTIEIPANITSIGRQVFNECTNLTTIIWNAKNANVNTTGQNSTLYYSPFNNIEAQITSITFGDEVEIVPKYLCYNMTSLTSVRIPNSVTAIGVCAFAGCTQLRNVYIGSGINTIESDAFSKSYLHEVTLPITELIVEATTPPAGGLNCGMNPSICTLYVPQESVEIYSNTLWWEDFFDIQPISNYGTGMDYIVSNEPNSIKIVRNGQIFIQRGDKKYTLQGQDIR